MLFGDRSLQSMGKKNLNKYYTVRDGHHGSSHARLVLLIEKVNNYGETAILS
jgi:hypothetical protein